MRTTFALGETADAWMKWVHYQTNSFIYMQLSCLVMYLVDARAGAEMYTFVVLAHIAKNLSKSFIASPRGFWFCTAGHAISCGGGYSLPSGHSMMSLLVLLFLAIRFPRHRKAILGVGALFELYTVFEIIYLGTHTPTDVVVGFTFALFVVALLLVWDAEPFAAVQRALVASPELLALVLAAVTALVYTLELMEEAHEDAAVHPLEWQANYESYCRLQPGSAARHMRNSSAFEKTALMIGLTGALYVRQRLGLVGDGGSDEGVVPRVVRAAATFGVLTYSKRLLKLALIPVIFAELTGPWKYLVYVVQPFLLLVVFPVLLHALQLGRFIAPFSHSKKHA
eukprot:Unigene4189_Nuclearia_a/m.12761 Unigene4189_Nuclearia_a/g.12761  ORF Unigene4189_Nuclearia_a/g.12761 Unigene4189_Nuclearia_a/m.12761 type:complete len:339 (-) Unigene4189_Nuclearia_a:5-1021(-)